MADFEPLFRNFPNGPKRLMPRHKRPCSLSPAELDARIRELHEERHRLLSLSRKRVLTAGEVRLAKHILRELDWYEMHEAEPGFKAIDERVKRTRQLLREVKSLAKRCGVTL